MPSISRHLRSLGPRVVVCLAGEQLWYTKRFFGLVAPLPPIVPRPAKIAIDMRPVDARSFGGFEDELQVATGNDYAQVLLRRSLGREGPGELYVAADGDGRPIYAQWLIRPRDRAALYEHSPGRYAELGEKDVLVEGAYTFVRFRGLGAMRDGMAKLLQLAADEGMVKAFTYVEVHNIPSLRGCAEVGFVPHHMRDSVRRLGMRRGSMQPVTDEDRTVWEKATG